MKINPGLILSLLLYSCTSSDPGLISYQLSLTDFIEKTEVIGTIQASNTHTVLSPRLRGTSDMIVVYLAKEGSFVKKGDTVCILEANELIRQYDNIIDRLDRQKMDLNKLIIDHEINIASLQSQIENMEIKVALNSLDSIQKQFAPPVSQELFILELEKANVEKQKLQKRYQAQKQIFDAEKRRLNSRIRSTETELSRIQEQMNQLTLTAPVDGLVLHTIAPTMYLYSSMGIRGYGGKVQVNSAVYSNTPLLRIPDLERMEVLAEVQEADYRRILAGQNVYIQVSGLNTTGKVKRKALTGKPTSHQSTLLLYEITIDIDSLHPLLTPGLSARCEIMINEVKDTIVVPTLAIFEKDSLKIVYVAEGDRFLAIPVEIGLANSSVSMVTKGLFGNETITLAEPPARFTVKVEPAVPDSTVAISKLNNTTYTDKKK